MNYETTSTTTEQKKDNRSLIYGLLIAALLGTWGYIIYDKSKTNEQVKTLSSQNSLVTTERDEVRGLYNSSLSRFCMLSVRFWFSPISESNLESDEL